MTRSGPEVTTVSIPPMVGGIGTTVCRGIGLTTLRYTNARDACFTDCQVVRKEVRSSRMGIVTKMFFEPGVFTQPLPLADVPNKR